MSAILALEEFLQLLVQGGQPPLEVAHGLDVLRGSPHAKAAWRAVSKNPRQGLPTAHVYAHDVATFCSTAVHNTTLARVSKATLGLRR